MFNIVLRKDLDYDKFINDGIWVDGAGNQKYMQAMSDAHIENCIDFLSKGYYKVMRRRDIDVPSIGTIACSKPVKIPLPKCLEDFKQKYIVKFNEELENR